MMIPLDKKLHAAVGFAIAAVGTSTAWALNASMWSSVGSGLAAAFLAGLIKEVLDWNDNRRQRAKGLPVRHGVEFLDWVATFAGGVIFEVFFSSLVLLGRWIASLMLLAVLLLTGCASPVRALVPVIPKNPETTGSIEEQRAAILKTRDQLRDKLDATELRLKQADRDLDAERIRIRQRWCAWIAGLMFVASVVAGVAAVMLPIPRKLTVGISVTCLLLGFGAILFQVLLPYLVIISLVVFGLLGLVGLFIISPRLHALHELSKVDGIPHLHLDAKARKGLDAAVRFSKAKLANAQTDIFPKVGK